MNTHKKVIPLCLFIILFFQGCISLQGCDSNKSKYEPYCVAIKNPDEIKSFKNDLDDVWIPDKNDVAEFKAALKQYLSSDRVTATETKVNRSYILSNLSEYNIEYAGFIKDGIQYMFCNLILGRELKPSNDFSFIMDGGCGVMRVIYNVKEKTIVSIECNGEA